jgi:uncharacterized cupin superfamily protein
MARHPNIVRLSDIPEEPLASPDGTRCGGVRQRIGNSVGAEKLGYGVFTVPPGKTAFPSHVHGVNEEMIYILDGQGTLRFGNERIPVESGTFIACPSGYELSHQLINDSARALRYLVVSTMVYPDIVEYPDSNKIGVYTGPSTSAKKPFRALYEKGSEVPYFHGETGSGH